MDAVSVAPRFGHDADQLAGYPDCCPYEAEHPKKNVLCPYGFGGLRHLIEEPPSVRKGCCATGSRVPARPGGVSPQLALNPELTREHFSRLRGICRRLRTAAMRLA